MSTQFATRVDDETAQLFRDTTQLLGTSPSDAMRMFITAFNRCGGFPYEVRLAPPYEAIRTEEEATDFCNHLAQDMLDAAR